MNICILGDSVAKGVLLDSELDRYVCGKEGFADRLRNDGNEVNSYAVFGCTVSKGLQLAQRHASRLDNAQTILLEFGGNDCDYDWDKIAEDPLGEHLPNTSVENYLQDYAKLIYLVQSHGATPVVMTLPPIDSRRYFNWFSRKMTEEGKKNIISWLGGDIEFIHKWHEMYNDQLCALARSMDVQLADVREAFYDGDNFCDFLCADGIHPNPAGQELIYSRLKSLVFQRRCA